MSGIASFFVEGGIWMYPIAAVSVVAVAVVAERVYALMFLYNTNGPELFRKVLPAVQNHNDAQAIEACNRAGKSSLAHVLKNAIVYAPQGEDAVSSSIEVSTLEVLPDLQKRTNSLGGLSSLATLLGLLGTVMGLIDAFRVVAEAPADQKSILLTKSIAVAMNTTAFGLLIAIPVTMVYILLIGTTKKITDEIDVYSLKLENALRSRKK